MPLRGVARGRPCRHPGSRGLRLLVLTPLSRPPCSSAGPGRHQAPEPGSWPGVGGWRHGLLGPLPGDLLQGPGRPRYRLSASWASLPWATLNHRHQLCVWPGAVTVLHTVGAHGKNRGSDNCAGRPPDQSDGALGAAPGIRGRFPAGAAGAGPGNQSSPRCTGDSSPPERGAPAPGVGAPSPHGAPAQGRLTLPPAHPLADQHPLSGSLRRGVTEAPNPQRNRRGDARPVRTGFPPGRGHTDRVPEKTRLRGNLAVRTPRVPVIAACGVGD